MAMDKDFVDQPTWSRQANPFKHCRSIRLAHLQMHQTERATEHAT